MKLIEVWADGSSAILLHRFSENAEGAGASGEGKGTRRVHIRDENPRDVAERCVYRDGGFLMFPGAAISRLTREAGGSHKQRGSRKTLKYIIPAAMIVTDELLPFYTPDHKTRLKDFEIDSRPVTIPATKGRIMRIRARLNAWSLKFTLRVNDNLLDPSTIHTLVTEGGSQIGLGDFRPEKGGPFGTFQVVQWKEIGEDKRASTAHAAE